MSNWPHSASSGDAWVSASTLAARERLGFAAWASPSRAAALWASAQSSGRSGPAVPPWGLSESPPKTPVSLRFTTQELEPECKWPLLSAAWQVDSAALVALRLATPAAWEARLSVWAALRTPKARLCRPDRGGATKLLILHRSTPRRRYSPRRWGGAERPRHGSRRAGALTRSAPPTTTTKWRARKRGTRTRRPARATGLGCGRVSPVSSRRAQRYSLIGGASTKADRRFKQSDVR